MTDPRYALDRISADRVLAEIRRVCEYRDWPLLAAHVRSTHVHVVAAGIPDPDAAIGEFKRYCSRVLNAQEGSRTRWSRGGSTRRLPDAKAIENAVCYVADRQGPPMAVFVAECRI